MITIKEEQFIIEHVGVPKFWISMEINIMKAGVTKKS